MRTRWLATLAAPLLLAASPLITPSEGAFLADAVRNDSAQVEFGKLAVRFSLSPKVRAYGDQLAAMRTTHRVQAAAMAKLLDVPTRQDLSTDAARALERLSALRGEPFDRAFKQQVIADHQREIAASEKLVKTGGNLGVRALTEQTLPRLRRYLQRAQAL